MIDIALDAKTNDISLSGSGNINTTQNLVQSIVIMFRLFLGEYDFDIDLGMPWVDAFDGTITESNFRIEMERQLITIEGIEDATVSIQREQRELIFNILIQVLDGDEFTISIGDNIFSINGDSNVNF